MRAVRQHRQSLDLAAMGETAVCSAKELFRHVARLNRQHAHPVIAVKRLGCDCKRWNIALVPVDEHELPGSVLCHGSTGFNLQAHVSIGCKRNCAFIGHVHRCHPERSAR